jgi:hypothetical protein
MDLWRAMMSPTRESLPPSNPCCFSLAECRRNKNPRSFPQAKSHKSCGNISMPDSLQGVAVVHSAKIVFLLSWVSAWSRSSSWALMTYWNSVRIAERALKTDSGEQVGRIQERCRRIAAKGFRTNWLD